MIAVLRLLLLAAVLSFGVRSHARADGVRVDTYVDPCVPLDRERFVYLLGIELGSAAASNATATLTLSCSDSVIQLSVEDMATHKVVSRPVDITSVEPNERERLMALTASELVLASLSEVGMESRAAAPPPPAPVLPASERAEAPPQSPPLRLGADVTGTTFLSALAPIFGLALHLTHPLSRAWAGNLSLQLGRGSLDGKLGDDGQHLAISATTATLGWGVRYTQSLAEIDVWAGLAGELGLAYLKGSRAGPLLDSTPRWAPWVGPALQLGAAYRAGQRARILLQIEAGVLVLGSRAVVEATPTKPEQLVLELRGGWLGANVGFDYTL